MDFSAYGSLSIRMGHSQTSVSAGQLQPELGGLAPGADGGRAVMGTCMPGAR